VGLPECARRLHQAVPGAPRAAKVYEKARLWIAAHPDETAQIIANESKVSLAVAKLQLSRNDFSQPQPGPKQIAAPKAAAPILTQEQLVKPGTKVSRSSMR
jgi:sulfonate transport system substrate-binding protein